MLIRKRLRKSLNGHSCGHLSRHILGSLFQSICAARRLSCANNLKQIGLAIHLHEDQFKRLPPSRKTEAESPTWAWLILPNLEQDNLYRLWPDGWPYPGLAPGAPITPEAVAYSGKVLSTPVPTYFCPSFRSPGDDNNTVKPFPQDLG